MVAGAGEVAQMTWHLGVQPEGRISLPSREVRKDVPGKGVSMGSGSGGAQRVSGLGVVSFGSEVITGDLEKDAFAGKRHMTWAEE